MTFPADMLVLTNLAALLFWPRARVAMVREEFEGRLEVLSMDGDLAHRPGPLDSVAGPPFVEAAPGTLVNRAHAETDAGGIRLPGGWRVPGSLPPGGPPPSPEPSDPWIEDAGARASQVLYVDAGGRGGSGWVTDRGRAAGDPKLSGRRKAALHPDLRRAGQNFYVNPRRLRSLARDPEDRSVHVLEFDDGTSLRLTKRSTPVLVRSLGLADREWAGGETEGQRHLRHLGIRRWPVRLATAPRAFLAREFAGEPARLVANLAMQTFEGCRRGEDLPEGDGHRAWYYVPAQTALYRAGHMQDLSWAAARPEEAWGLDWADHREVLAEKGRERRRYRTLEHADFGARVPLDEDGAWTLTCKVLTYLVFVARFFIYQQIGFRDQKPQYRLLGSRHPEVVVLVEKDSLLETARALHEALGVTVFVTGGLPPLIGAEFLVKDLLARGVRQVRILSFCDFDVVGWELPAMFAPQLEHYGMPVAEIRRLVTPDRFTEEELLRLSVPLDPTRNPRYRSRMRKWLEETGGIHGEARGIFANMLKPPGRVLEAVLEVAGDWVEG